jgi:hypothetical protein
VLLDLLLPQLFEPWPECPLHTIISDNELDSAPACGALEGRWSIHPVFTRYNPKHLNVTAKRGVTFTTVDGQPECSCGTDRPMTLRGREGFLSVEQRAAKGHRTCRRWPGARLPFSTIRSIGSRASVPKRDAVGRALHSTFLGSEMIGRHRLHAQVDRLAAQLVAGPVTLLWGIAPTAAAVRVERLGESRAVLLGTEFEKWIRRSSVTRSRSVCRGGWGRGRFSLASIHRWVGRAAGLRGCGCRCKTSPVSARVARIGW